MDTGATKKQEAILDLSLKVGERLEGLTDLLNNSFNRVAGVRPTCSEQSQPANVLDGIIAVLEDANRQVASIHRFINDEVIPKIH